MQSLAFSVGILKENIGSIPIVIQPELLNIKSIFKSRMQTNYQKLYFRKKWP